MIRARALRSMLEELVRHREAMAASAPYEPLEVFDAGDITLDELPPLWRERMEQAAIDGVEESLHASIREEGWRAFAEGGLDAMHALVDEACGDSDYLSSIVDHRWDGIGTEAGGYWVA